MNNIVKEIQMLIDTNQLDIAVHNLMDGSNKIQKFINTYIWSQERLQDLILNQSKGDLCIGMIVMIEFLPLII